MTTETVVVETRVPADIYQTLAAAGVSRADLSEESRRLLALRFYQDRTLSLGKAARWVGMNRWEFIEFLSDNGVPVLDYTDEELAAESDAALAVEEQLRQ